MPVRAHFDLVFGASSPDALVVVAIVAARLLIPRIPLVIVVAFVLDAVDHTVLEALTDVDT